MKEECRPTGLRHSDFCIRTSLLPDGQKHILEQDDGQKCWVQVVTKLSRESMSARPLPAGKGNHEAIRRLNPATSSCTSATLFDPADAGLPKLLNVEFSVPERL